jgi:ribosomal-protein-alanine N-acetyltransferase
MMVLQTARLTSRPIEITDAQAVFAAYASDPMVARYMTWRVHDDVSGAERYLAAMVPLMAQDGRQVLVLLERSDPARLIGVFEARFDAHRMNVGYVLGRPYWGRGLMTEALSAAVAWARATPSLRRVWAVCDVDNRASARVMEKSGLLFEGVLRRWVVHPNIDDAPRDCACYAATW